MATRKPDNAGAVDPALPQKKRARRRLIGALAICVAAAIVLPLVLDSEPRQIRDDVQVQIPSRDTPLTDPLPGTPGAKDPGAATGAPESGVNGNSATAEGVRAGPPTVAPEQASPVVPAQSAAGGTKAPQKSDAATVARGVETKPAASPQARPAPKSEEKSTVKAEEKPAPRAEEKPASRGTESPAAKTEDNTADHPKAGGFVLQLGAFSSADGAARMTAWARKAGVSTHTEKVATKNGERIRVRAGPYATRAEAERAKAKLRASHLEATLIAP